MTFTKAEWAFRGSTLTLIAFSIGSTSINAQSLKSPSAVVHFAPPPAPNKGVPSGRRQGGSSRGDCPLPAGNQPLTAIVPATTMHSNRKPGTNPALGTWDAVWGLTASASPTFLFYVPYSLTPKLPALFILQDEQGNNIYQTSLTASSTYPSIVKVRLPATTPLQAGKMYHWYFVIDCHPDAPPQVDGWVQRTVVSPILSNQLQKTSPRQRVALYAANGVWYDALTTLAQLRSAYPQDVAFASDWRSLLSSVGLKMIASEPISD